MRTPLVVTLAVLTLSPFLRLPPPAALSLRLSVIPQEDEHPDLVPIGPEDDVVVNRTRKGIKPVPFAPGTIGAMEAVFRYHTLSLPPSLSLPLSLFALD